MKQSWSLWKAKLFRPWPHAKGQGGKKQFGTICGTFLEMEVSFTLSGIDSKPFSYYLIRLSAFIYQCRPAQRLVLPKSCAAKLSLSSSFYRSRTWEPPNVFNDFAFTFFCFLRGRTTKFPIWTWASTVYCLLALKKKHSQHVVGACQVIRSASKHILKPSQSARFGSNCLHLLSQQREDRLRSQPRPGCGCCFWGRSMVALWL